MYRFIKFLYLFARMINSAGVDVIGIIYQIFLNYKNFGFSGKAFRKIRLI